jgi:hypothetical protein
MSVTVPIGAEGTGAVSLVGGAGMVKVGPGTNREVWTPTLASVNVTTQVDQAQCLWYVGQTANNLTFVDSTLSASTGDATGRIGAFVLYYGWWVWAAFTGGDSGSVATLLVAGTKTIR